MKVDSQTPICAISPGLLHLIVRPLTDIIAEVPASKYNYEEHMSGTIFCRTSSCSQSFFPSAFKLWNSMPDSIKSSKSVSQNKFLLSLILSPSPPPPPPPFSLYVHFSSFLIISTSVLIHTSRQNAKK